MNSKKVLIFGWIVIALFVFGIIQLLLLRFSAGDVFPFYSSLRADPLGTKALYESLEICCGFNVERNHEPFSRIKERFDATVFVLGMRQTSLAAVPKSITEDVNYFISSGGRLVISIYRPQKQEDVLRVVPEEDEGVMDLTDIWGVRLFAEKRVTGAARLDEHFRGSGLPESISAHTPLYFQPVHSGWTTVYHRAQRPVLIERKLGRGSLVLSAESYFLSNEAMAKERYPSLLVWLVGNQQSVIFDEYHHGIAATSGVMYLARKYDLEWMFLVLLMLALLFIWKNAAPFVPPDQQTGESLQSGKESVAGLTNLLRRNVAVPQLLSVCYSEWQKSAKNMTDQNKKEMEKILANEIAKPARHRDLPAAYNALSRALKQRR